MGERFEIDVLKIWMKYLIHLFVIQLKYSKEENVDIYPMPILIS